MLLFVFQQFFDVTQFFDQLEHKKRLGFYDNFQKFFGSSNTYNAHNQFLAYLMFGGAVILLLFIYIIFRFYKVLYKIYKHTRSIEIYMGIVLLSCFMALSISGHPFLWTTILWYLMILLGLINVPLNKKIMNNKNVSKKNNEFFKT